MHHRNQLQASSCAFSSRKCPPASGLEHSLELPFGFLWSPFGDTNTDKNDDNNKSTTTTTTTTTCSEPIVLKQNNQLPPVICVACLSYRNPFATHRDLPSNDRDSNPTSKTSTTVWICPFCQFENVEALDSNDTKIPNSSFRNITSTSSEWEVRQPLTNHNDHNVDSISLVLVIDRNLPSHEAHNIGSMLQSLLQERRDQHERNGHNHSIQSIQLGLVVFGKNVSVYHLGIASGMASADTISSHQGLNMDRLQQRSYLTDSNNVDAVLNCLAAQFGIRESSPMDNTSTSGPGIIPQPKTRMEILKERKEARLRAQHLQQQVGEPESKNGNSGSSSINHNNNNQRKNVTQLPQSRWVAARTRTAETQPKFRCTGEAVQCALDLVTTGGGGGGTKPSRTARILVFTNGCPSFGDGSVVGTSSSHVNAGNLARSCQYFEVLAKTAVEVGVGVDVFCTGASELGLPAYQSLVEPSSGYVISMETFGGSHLMHNVRFILEQTYLSLAQFVSMDKAKEEETKDGYHHAPVSTPSTTEWIEGCTVDIRLSSFLSATHLIGPGELMENPTGPLLSEQSAFDTGLQLVDEQFQRSQQRHPRVILPSKEMLQPSALTRIRLGRVDPASTFSVMLQLNDFFQHDKFVYFQGVVRYIDPMGKFLITHVTTHRLSVAKDVNDFLEAVDEEVISVLLGKEAVYRSMFGREVNEEHPFLAPHTGLSDTMAYDAQQDLDNTIFRISGTFRLLHLEHGTKRTDLTEEGGIKATGSSLNFAFPPKLSKALRRLYHLRRGPFLSPGPLQSLDDRAALRSLFVRLPLVDCLDMMSPSLWSSGPLDVALAQGEPLYEEVPPETLSLWENRIIAADHWHILFVWSGSAAMGREYDTIRQHLKDFLQARTKNRFPMPNLHLLNETDSMSRRFTALLAPAHGDPVEHQLAHFPALASLSIEEQRKLHEKFRFYDPESDPSFRKWFWEVASAASGIKAGGISLCD